MHSKDIFDGLELSVFRFAINVGAMKHRYSKDQKENQADIGSSEIRPKSPVEHEQSQVRSCNDFRMPFYFDVCS